MPAKRSSTILISLEEVRLSDKDMSSCRVDCPSVDCCSKLSELAEDPAFLETSPKTRSRMNKLTEREKEKEKQKRHRRRSAQGDWECDDPYRVSIGVHEYAKPSRGLHHPCAKQ